MNAFNYTRIVLQILNLAVLTVSSCALADEKVQPSKDEPRAGVDSTEPKQRGALTVFTPDRKFFASLSPAGTIKYCAADGAVLRTFHQCSPSSAVFSKDGALLCSAGQYNRGVGAIKVWRVADGQLIAKLNSESDEVPKLAFSADARLLACTAGKSRINLWEIPESKLRWSASLNRGITSLSFDKSEATVIARCADKSSKRLAVVDGGLIQASRSEGTEQCRIHDDRGELVANEL